MATIVKKKPGQSDDSLVNQFRKKIFNEDIIGEIKKREYYTKPSRKKYEREKVLKKLKRRKRQPSTTR
jgi:ribosomal protein S21